MAAEGGQKNHQCGTLSLVTDHGLIGRAEGAFPSELAAVLRYRNPSVLSVYNNNNNFYLGSSALWQKYVPSTPDAKITRLAAP